MTKILLVEDDKSLREIYGVRLLAEGYDIVSAGDGEEALAMAIKERPDLIVSDVMMPKISGFDMLDILRSTTETKNIKVIMMTALSSEDQRQRGEQLGADRYLVKSQVGIEDVVRTVHEVLGDAPVAKPTFETTAPSAAPNAAPSATPSAVNQPAMAPAASAPDLQPQTHQQPAYQQQPAPSQPKTPQQHQATSAAPAQSQDDSQASFPPQPTAPFASPRPATLGERVIQPLEGADFSNNNDDIAERIAAELGEAPAAVEPAAEPQQQQPAAQPQSEAPEQPQPQPEASSPTPINISQQIESAPQQPAAQPQSETPAAEAQAPQQPTPAPEATTPPQQPAM